ncbi:hypothetical protein CDD81_5111 [Ophiocordyceps australis]|uniref:Oxysterol-binding protein n=1 Tax=Ophiocordyceps australis TaxID=1399860 RepID=A0A2C5Y8H4_9HYPO|nr:hypothetical protein CDD81_5111 [Ophiocordyceps australis]
MSEAGDNSSPSSHRRSKSAAALALLRRRESRDDELAGGETAAAGGQTWQAPPVPPGSTLEQSADAPADETTLLHLAIQCAELPVVEQVLAGAAQGRTPVVKLLLDRNDINDAVANLQGKLPLDVARNPDIFQLLQLSRSLFAEAKMAQVLEEPRLKTLLDINSPEFVSDPATLHSGGTLLHEAARARDTQLVQSVTPDDAVKAVLKRSPAAVAAQRGIQEKAVLGHAASHAAPADLAAGRESREIKGYLKNYYKHQDDAGSACRGAINMKIAKLHMSADEKTKFEIIGKSSVKYSLKANHEVEAKRWFWALNNSIQWTKDQAKEDERQAARSAELFRQAKAEHSGSLSAHESVSESASLSDQQRSASAKLAHHHDHDDDDDDDTEAQTASVAASRAPAHAPDYDEDDDDRSMLPDAAATKDALNITAQSAKLQLETMSGVHAALLAQLTQNPSTPVSHPPISQALSTYDAAMRSLSGLVGDLLRISRDRDAYWQYRLDRESNMRRMWEESMQRVAREHEELEARVGQVEIKRRLTKRALREVMLEGGNTPTMEKRQAELEAHTKSPTATLGRKGTALDQLGDLSESDSGGEDEFFDAVDAGQVQVSQLPLDDGAEAVVVDSGLDISPSFRGYENGIRHRLKLDADNRPQISLWGILKSMIGKDMTKMTLPVSFNEPTSLLYRCGEDMEYADLLDLAAERSDSIERLIYVAAFAASEYASTIGRVAKPFNPLLGETFEYVRPDKKYRFFIEQVSHHPPVGAAWAESPNWTYWGESAVRSKFYGKSFDINPLGTWFLRLRPKAGGKEDLYTWKKVTSSVIGIITGNPTVDNYGPMEVKNWTTGEVAQLDFKARGWKASSAYQVSGKIVDGSGQVRVSMGGRWNSRLYARLTPGFEASVDEGKDGGRLDAAGGMTDPSRAYLVWEANARPKGIPFNLTPFVLTFNHIDDKLRPWLAPTDSRLRPDQRAMEDGEYDLAAREKNRLEESQRARRRAREARGDDFVPAWFERARCDVTGEDYWRFTGRYWLQRNKAGPQGDAGVAWEGLEPIFDDFAA